MIDSWTSEGMNWDDVHLAPAYPYLEAIRLATVERCRAKQISTSIYLGGEYGTVDISTKTIPYYLFPLSYAIYLIIRYNLCNWTTSPLRKGFVKLEQPTTTMPFYTDINILQEIGDTQWYEPTRNGERFSDFLKQSYKILNKLRWVATQPNTITVYSKEGSYNGTGTGDIEADLEPALNQAAAAWQAAEWQLTYYDYGLQECYFSEDVYYNIYCYFKNYKVSASVTNPHLTFAADFYGYAEQYYGYYYYSTDGYLQNRYNLYYSNANYANNHQSPEILTDRQIYAFYQNPTLYLPAIRFNIKSASSYSRYGYVIQKYDNSFQFKNWE
ncbi:MAG: hypothetical protein SNJ71_00805 [Bacteroidales bacterium]